jgi:6,7-dimethyl-8-ribityllumazine synthase
MHQFVGDLMAKDLHIAVVVARFNEMVTQPLLDGAVDCLKRHGVDMNHVNTYWVPGAFEIPVVAERLMQKGLFDCVICLGAVIRGDTPHFEQVVGSVTSGCAQVALKHGKPVVFGVLTTDTVDQALNRAGLKSGNKGWEAALSAIEMANLMKQI